MLYLTGIRIQGNVGANYSLGELRLNDRKGTRDNAVGIVSLLCEVGLQRVRYLREQNKTSDAVSGQNMRELNDRIS